MPSRSGFSLVLALLLPVLLASPCFGQASGWGHLSGSGIAYPMPPLRYEGNRLVGVTFTTSPEIVRELVPEPLVVGRDSLLILYVAALRMVEPEEIVYHEAGLLVPAAYDDSTRGSYVPVLYLDRALPITIGREVWGFPKFAAEISLETADGVIEASVTKDGHTLIDLTLEPGEPVTPGPARTETYIVRKTIPSAVERGAYDLDRLVTARLLDSRSTEIIPGRAELRLGSTPTDPLGRIPVERIVSAVYLVGGFTLDRGEVLHDYLAE